MIGRLFSLHLIQPPVAVVVCDTGFLTVHQAIFIAIHPDVGYILRFVIAVRSPAACRVLYILFQPGGRIKLILHRIAQGVRYR